MDIGSTEKVFRAIPHKGSIPGLPNEGVEAFPIYFVMENTTPHTLEQGPEWRVLTVHLNEQAAWDAITRLDPTDERTLTVASYDPNEEGAAS